MSFLNTLELNPGEKILWSSAPEEFETLDKTHKKPFINKVILSWAVCILLDVLYVSYAVSHGTDVKVILVIFMLFCAFMMSISGFHDAKRIKELTYVVTNQRLAVVSDSVKDVNFSTITQAQIMADADAHHSLLCGSGAIKAKAHARRPLTLLGARNNDETGICESFVFYAVPAAELVKLKSTLSEYIPF